MTLEEAVKRVPEFKAWTNAERILFFMWYLHTYKKQEQVAPRDIVACFDQLHIDGPGVNTGRAISRLTETRPKQVLKSKVGYRLEQRVRGDFDARYAQQTLAIHETVQRHDAHSHTTDFNAPTQKRQGDPPDSASELDIFVDKCNTLIGISKTARKNRISLTSHSFYAPKARLAIAELKVAESALSTAISGIVSISVQANLKSIITLLSQVYTLIPNYAEYISPLEEARTIAATELKVALEAAQSTRKKVIILQREFIPEELLENHEKVPRQILHEINVSYEYGCFNGCAVLVRRLVESLIILAFEVHGIGAAIKDANGNYLGLEALIARAQQSSDLSLTRNAKSGLPKPKFYGDLAAHNPRALVRKGDLDGAQSDLRVVIEELGALSSPAKRTELTKHRPGS